MINNLVLIGSRALEFRAPDILNRKPKDFDFICTQDAFKEFYDKFADKIQPKKLWSPSETKIILEGKTICEFEIAKDNSSADKFLEIVKQDPNSLRTDFGLIPNINLLFCLKKSHRFVKDSPHFFKTFIDYHRLKHIGCKSDAYSEWLALREKETYANQKHPKLNLVKKEFFDENSFKYTFDHDSIHIAMANNIIGGSGSPAYLAYAADGEEVKSDKKKFFQAKHEIQIRGALEETMVLACERSLHPHPGKLTEKEAFLMAFSKLASSISSGWFREFVYENGPEIICLMPTGYSDVFQNSIKSGIVKAFKEN